MNELKIDFGKYNGISKKMIFVFCHVKQFSHLAHSCEQKSPEEFKIFGNRQFEFKNFLFHFVNESDGARGMMRSSGREGNFYMYYPCDPGYYFSPRQIEEIERINAGRLKLIKTIKDFNFLLENGKLPGKRTIGEILESLKEGEIPSHEECYWTLLALAKRLEHAESSILEAEVIIKESLPSISPILEKLFWVAKNTESFKKLNPKESLGKDITIPTLDNNFREMSKIIVEKAIREQYE
jgi:hypothetical protein